MEIIKNPDPALWEELLKRPQMDLTSLLETVEDIFNSVKQRGDSAVREYTLKFDGVEQEMFAVPEREIGAATSQLDNELKRAITAAAGNIERFHNSQKNTEPVVATMEGVECWRRSVAIDKVGLYIPGGSAPLFSTVLMLGIPAKLAGCGEVVLCTPPRKDGNIDPAILFAANLVGINKIYAVGGVQAIAAMTWGTDTVPAVYKIFGPGNQYVTAAKQLALKYGVAIDMPAGPSEVMVYADETGNPAFIAADLLAQAEHGNDSQVIFVSTSMELLEKVRFELDRQMIGLLRKEIVLEALKSSRLILVDDFRIAMNVINFYAPEHLILMCENEEDMLPGITNAGSVFLGLYTPESAGDYASGTNHTLPTNGYARAYSGVSLDSFVKKITYQRISKEGLDKIGPIIEVMAKAEQLDAHKNAVTIRMKS